jgi:hypothetical protein
MPIYQDLLFLTRNQRRVILRGRGHGLSNRGHVTGLQLLVGLLYDIKWGVVCLADESRYEMSRGCAAVAKEPQITSGTKRNFWQVGPFEKFLCHCVGYCRSIQYDSVPKTRNAFDGLVRLYV